MKKKLKLASLFAFGLILFMACEKETPPPTASFTYAVEGNVVVFTAEATDYTNFEWDYGDGSYISSIETPTHAYSEYGKDFTVSLTVLGDGGEVTVTNTVTIPAKTKLQLLTGGTPDDPGSKKWRFNEAAPYLDVTYADANLTSAIPEEYRFGGVLNSVGLGAAYKDEFEFKSDGTLTVHSKGGGILASLAYVMANSIPPSAYYEDLGMAYTASFTNPAGATFMINEDKDYTINTPLGSVTYANVMTFSFTNGGFLGLMDFTTECMIRSLSDTQMEAVIFYAHPSYGPSPMLALIVTFEVAP